MPSKEQKMARRRGQRGKWVTRAVELMREEEMQGEVVAQLVEEFGIEDREAWFAVARARAKLGWTAEKKKQAVIDSAVERAEEVRARALKVVKSDEADRVAALARMTVADDQLNKLAGAYEPERLDVTESSKYEAGADEALERIELLLKKQTEV